HVESVGPGRLAISRSVWTKGASVTVGVQDFAYQALENLSFETLSAQIDSVNNGRLQILFHVKGKNDPTKAGKSQEARLDQVEGHALEKPVALPKGTPIELTLDTSLNFDELLRAYREAWSQGLADEGTGKRGKR